MITLEGNTYKHREEIKALGFKWNSQCKFWSKPELEPGDLDALKELRGLIIEQDAEEIADTRTHKQKFGTCEDAPCCGCCGY